MSAQSGGGALAALDPHVRRLGRTDLAACVHLAADRDWPPEQNKWQLLFRAGEVLGIDDPAGSLAAMVVLTRYGRELAAVGMMVVASRYGRQGIGGLLLSHVLGLAGGAVVHLTATSYGLPLYQRLGFRVVDTVDMHAGTVLADRPGASTGNLRAASPADLGQMAALDLRVFGADRRRVLAELFGFAEQILVARDGGTVTGFASAWRNGEYLVIGPLVARDSGIARALISGIAAGPDQLVRLDLCGIHRDLADWVTARGLAASGRTALMVRGGDLPGDRSQLFAPVSVAMG